MIAALKKYPFILFVLIYLATRLTNLTLLPIFSDEANYLDWGWRGIHGTPFHALYDAKQPFLMWLFGFGEIIFSDPLWGARFISTLTGLLSLTAIYKIGRRLFDPKVTHVALLLYIFIPFFIFFDRQALMESSLVAVNLWTFYFLHQFFTLKKLKTGLIIGSLLGLGFFIKTSAAIFLVSFILTVISYRSWKLLNYLIFALIAFTLVNLPLFFQPLFWSTLGRNSQYSFTLAEILHFPIANWLSNLFTNSQILILNLTPLVLLFIILGFIKYRPSKLFYLWLLIPLAIFSLSSRTAGYLSFRYLTPFIPLLIFPAAQYLCHRSLWLSIATLSLPIISSLFLIFSPINYFQIKSHLTSHSYISDYVTGFDTGYQVNAIRHTLDNLTQNQPAYIAMAIHAFNPEAALLTYYRKSSTSTPIFFDSTVFGPEFISQYDCVITDRPLFFVAKLNDTAGLEKYLTKITTVTNSQNHDFSTIYTLKTNCPSDRTIGIHPLL